jgi:hypothetical protein
MKNSVLDAKHFHDEEAAYAYLEARIWPNGPVCPHCGGVDRIGKMDGTDDRRKLGTGTITSRHAYRCSPTLLVYRNCR